MVVLFYGVQNIQSEHKMAQINWQYYSIILYIVIPIQAFVQLVAKIIELIYIIKTKRFRTSSSIYIINLTLTNITTGVLAFPSTLVSPTLWGWSKEIGYARWFFSNAGIQFSLYASIFTLLALTIDRLIAVIRPSFYRIVKNKHAMYVCFGTWFLSISIAFGMLFT